MLRAHESAVRARLMTQQTRQIDASQVRGYLRPLLRQIRLERSDEWRCALLASRTAQLREQCSELQNRSSFHHYRILSI